MDCFCPFPLSVQGKVDLGLLCLICRLISTALSSRWRVEVSRAGCSKKRRNADFPGGALFEELPRREEARGRMTFGLALWCCLQIMRPNVIIYIAFLLVR